MKSALPLPGEPVPDKPALPAVGQATEAGLLDPSAMQHFCLLPRCSLILESLPSFHVSLIPYLGLPSCVLMESSETQETHPRHPSPSPLLRF